MGHRHFFHHLKSAATPFNKNIKKKVKNFKKHQRLKDHYNWVHFSSGPVSSQAPRQALATQWVALATVLKR